MDGLIPHVARITMAGRTNLSPPLQCRGRPLLPPLARTVRGPVHPHETDHAPDTRSQAEIIGFIADQSPKWQATHHWTRFLRHQTAFFIGSERIARQVDAALYYVRVTRPRRGYYRAELVLITLNPQSPDLDIQSEYPATDRYAQLLEQQIREKPELWLWTHNRWKRTYEQWLERNPK